MDLKAPLSYDEQIKKLEKHGIVVNDTEKAKKILKQINYYRYTGYALQFRTNPTNSNYVGNLSFEKIYRIYQFDESLRDVLRKYIEQIEVFYRTQISYGFAMIKCQKPPHDQHYNEANFCNKKGYREVMDSFKKEKNYYKDSLIVKHHQSKYSGKMPLWVIVELMSFSNISKLYSSMYFSEKDAIASSLGTGRNALENHLHCLAVLRNKCAHAARIYNTAMNPPAKFTPNFLRKNPAIANNSLFAYILILLQRLPDETSKDSFLTSLDAVIEEYKEDIDLNCIGFPLDYMSILKKNK